MALTPDCPRIKKHLRNEPPYPQKVLAINEPKLTSISATGNYDAGTCVIDGTQVKCWGDNTGGRCGSGSADAAVLSPTLVKLASGTALDDIVDLKAGDHVGERLSAFCALRDNGTLWCWGQGFGLSAGNIGATNVVALGTAEPRYLTSDGVYHVGTTLIEPDCGVLE